MATSLQHRTKLTGDTPTNELILSSLPLMREMEGAVWRREENVVPLQEKQHRQLTVGAG